MFDQWVSQCAEAFLGKIFACSYSIAGINALSGNPTDHLVVSCSYLLYFDVEQFVLC